MTALYGKKPYIGIYTDIPDMWPDTVYRSMTCLTRGANCRNWAVKIFNICLYCTILKWRMFIPSNIWMYIYLVTYQVKKQYGCYINWRNATFIDKMSRKLQKFFLNVLKCVQTLHSYLCTGRKANIFLFNKSHQQIAKIIQHTANVTPGKTRFKEDYMQPLNVFVEKHKKRLCVSY
jgi:hypothetical protein